jgi:hypothetical protein
VLGGLDGGGKLGGGESCGGSKGGPGTLGSEDGGGGGEGAGGDGGHIGACSDRRLDRRSPRTESPAAPMYARCSGHSGQPSDDTQPHHRQCSPHTTCSARIFAHSRLVTRRPTDAHVPVALHNAPRTGVHHPARWCACGQLGAVTTPLMTGKPPRCSSGLCRPTPSTLSIAVTRAPVAPDALPPPSHTVSPTDRALACTTRSQHLGPTLT